MPEVKAGQRVVKDHSYVKCPSQFHGHMCEAYIATMKPRNHLQVALDEKNRSFFGYGVLRAECGLIARIVCIYVSAQRRDWFSIWIAGQLIWSSCLFVSPAAGCTAMIRVRYMQSQLYNQIVSDRCKVVATSVPSSAVGHKESFPSPSLQYASICLRKGETGSAFGFLVTSSVAGCIAMMRVVHSCTPICRFQSFEEAKVRDSLDVCNLINFTISQCTLGKLAKSGAYPRPHSDRVGSLRWMYNNDEGSSISVLRRSKSSHPDLAVHTLSLLQLFNTLFVVLKRQSIRGIARKSMNAQMLNRFTSSTTLFATIVNNQIPAKSFKTDVATVQKIEAGAVMTAAGASALAPNFQLAPGLVRLTLGAPPELSENPVVIFARSPCCMCHVMKRLLISAVSVHPTVIELEEDEIAALRSSGAAAEDGGGNGPPEMFMGGHASVDEKASWHFTLVVDLFVSLWKSVLSLIIWYCN
uniref:Uncharacterized protein LOC104222506 n=1 Tax=Nicotiana sylvestris TaxID=4096 RepID=A0A1U7WBK5_NICSY|nr:PREDICTED: uncharacterized protein LOC104222506 [Nicotiana sylvestris]